MAIKTGHKTGLFPLTRVELEIFKGYLAGHGKSGQRSLKGHNLTLFGVHITAMQCPALSNGQGYNDAANFTNAGGLTSRELDFYGRQVVLPEIGTTGQQRLKRSTVVVVGAGGLGSPACLYLACSGVGTLRIVDGDIVSVSNLHRQIIHDLEKVGENKACNARAECLKRNDTINVEAIASHLTADNAESLFRDADVVVDATDNAQTRYLINDACVLLNIPLVSGSALRWEGQITIYNAPGLKDNCRRGPCYRCLFPQPPKVNNGNSCDMQGVFGPVPGIIGTLQAMETLKLCLGLYDACLINRMLIFDCLNVRRMWRSVELREASPSCQACGKSPSVVLQAYREFCPDEVYPALPESQCVSSQEFFQEALEIVPAANIGNRVLRVKPTIGLESDRPDMLIVDVRPPNHFQVTAIEGVVHLPVVTLLEKVSAFIAHREKIGAGNVLDLDAAQDIRRFLTELLGARESGPVRIFCLCRRGRDASKATQALNLLLNGGRNAHDTRVTRLLSEVTCRNVRGGMVGLQHSVKPLATLPVL